MNQWEINKGKQDPAGLYPSLAGTVNIKGDFELHEKNESGGAGKMPVNTGRSPGSAVGSPAVVVRSNNNTTAGFDCHTLSQPFLHNQQNTS